MTQLKGFKFVITLVLVFKYIESEDKTKYDISYSNSKAEIVINESDIDDVFQSIYLTHKYLGKGSRWITDSVIDHANSISKYDLLAGSSYIKLPKEFDDPRRGLINIHNIDCNEYFKWCLFRYLNYADHNPATILKADKDFAKKLNFKNKVRDTHKMEKKNSLSISVFWS